MTMPLTATIIHARPLAASTDAAVWYHLMPMGSHRTHLRLGPTHIEEIEEVIDQTACERIMASHAARAADPDWTGYLVDAEHASRRPNGSTEAYAWGRVIELRVGDAIPERERGIWIQLHKTPLGQDAIGSVYKYLSSVNLLEKLGDGRYRPVTIEDVGLTNRPAYKTLIPASHRDLNPEEDSTMLAKLKQLLAEHAIVLVADAGEDAVVEACKLALHTAAANATALVAITHRAETAEQLVGQLQRADLERAADAFMAEHGAKFADGAAAGMRTLYIEHRAEAEAIVKALRAPATPPPAPADVRTPVVLHRSATATPTPRAAAELQRERDRDTAIDAYVAEHRCARTLAWDVVRLNRPELFEEGAAN